MRLVLDTSVLIDHLRGRPPAATEIIPRAIGRGDELWSCQIVRAEVLAGMRPTEEPATRDLLRLIPGSTSTSPCRKRPERSAASTCGHTRASRVADLLVAALAQHLDAELKTTNVNHFPMFKNLKAPY